MSYGFPKEKKHVWANSRKIWFGPLRVQCCLPNNIILLVSVHNFEPDPILVNVNKLKPYTYVDQTLKGIQSLEDQKSLQSINKDHMEETSDEDSKD
jgi:hypothetical protein